MKKRTHWWIVIQKANGNSANGQIYYTRRAARRFRNGRPDYVGPVGYRKQDRQVVKVVLA